MKPTKVGRHTFRRLTNEEARQKYGTSFVFVGNPPPRPAGAPAKQAEKPACERKETTGGEK